MDYSWLILLVGGFALVNGANDGSTLVAAGLRLPAMRPVTAAAMIVCGLLAVPMLVTTQVATTLAGRLVDFDGAASQAALFVAILSATAVVLMLTRLGLPTSLTLALIGGIAGAGLGLGLPVSWPTVGTVIALGVLAPLAGGLGAAMLSRIPGRLPGGHSVSRWLPWLHRLGFGAQCMAYGANDGQKMLAVAAVAMSGGVVEPGVAQLALVGGCFALGLVLGLRRVAGTLTGKVTASRPTDTVAAEFSSAAAVAGTAALGAPVSMTQSIAGALMGSAAAHGARRVRWRAATSIAVAWLVTLPASAALGCSAASILVMFEGGGQ